MATIPPAVSVGFCQPSPALAVVTEEPEVTVNVGGGRVATVPVGVYDGSEETGPPLLIEAGGQVYDEITDAAIWPAPAPPVCHAFRGGLYKP